MPMRISKIHQVRMHSSAELLSPEGVASKWLVWHGLETIPFLFMRTGGGTRILRREAILQRAHKFFQRVLSFCFGMANFVGKRELSSACLLRRGWWRSRDLVKWQERTSPEAKEGLYIGSLGKTDAIRDPHVAISKGKPSRCQRARGARDFYMPCLLFDRLISILSLSLLKSSSLW